MPELQCDDCDTIWQLSQENFDELSSEEKRDWCECGVGE